MPVCVQNEPYDLLPRRVKKSHFCRGNCTAKEAMAKAEAALQKLQKCKEGEGVGSSAVASLKSMGVVKRKDGTYRLGNKFCAL